MKRVTIERAGFAAVLVTAVALLAGGATESPAAPLTLVKDGKPAASIVLPAVTQTDRYVAEKTPEIEAWLKRTHGELDDAAFAAELAKHLQTLQKEVKRVGDDEELAAQELQSIIERISGAKLPIVRVEAIGIPETPSILLGCGLARAARLGNRLDGLQKDGIVCTVRDNALILSGRRPRGTLYAVYDFLESLGCRWVMPGPFGELYPEMKTISTSIDKVQNPSHRERYWWCTYGHAEGYPQWTLRTKGNFVRALGDARVAQGHALSGPLRWGANQERYRVKVVRDGEETWTLPDDFYAQVNGKPHHAVPNMSNPRVWDMYADRYTGQFGASPFLRYVSISAEDGLTLDEHAWTRKLNSNEFDHFIGAPSATDRMWYFHNRVIDKVTAVHPDAKFGVLVYSNNMSPPRVERVHPNMALVFAPLGISPLHHVRDPKSKTNRSYREWFEDWMIMAEAAGAEAYYYDYEPMGYCWNMAMICPRWAIIGKNYPWFHQLGLDGHTTQGYDDWASCGLNNYLMQRLYWNVGQDYQDVIADYAKARFGAAAPAMVEYYDTLEKRMDEIPDLYSNEVWDNHLILTPAVRKQCRAILKKAAKLAGADRAKAHVQTMVDLQRSTDAMCDAIELAREKGDFGKAAEMMEVCFAVRDKLKELYPNFMNSARLDDKRKAQFMTGGIYNQYLGFDKKIKAARARLLLPRYWKGMLDTRNHAAALGYPKPDVSVKHLDELDVTVCPDVKYQTQREPAAFFYRTDVKVPRSFAGKKVTFYFPSVIAKGLQIWIDGKPVQFEYNVKYEDGDMQVWTGRKLDKDGAEVEPDTTYRDTIWRGPDYFWQNYNHEQEFDITSLVKPGKKQTIAFRVFKSFDFGGPYRRVLLLAN